jgi:hypothetical protein
MSDAFTFIQEAEALEKIQMLKPTTLKLAQQTTECAYFIRDYAKDRSFCGFKSLDAFFGADPLP